jgi:hypothetical protein
VEDTDLLKASAVRTTAINTFSSALKSLLYSALAIAPPQ